MSERMTVLSITTMAVHKSLVLCFCTNSAAPPAGNSGSVTPVHSGNMNVNSLNT